MPFYGRFDAATRALLHWSTAPFTVKPTATEVDYQFPDTVVIPGYLLALRVSVDGRTLVHDPALEPVAAPDPKLALRARALAAGTLADLQAVVADLLR